MDQSKTGKFIATMRKEKNLTQKDLAEKLLISDKTVSKWETGGGLPEVSLMIPLCKILEISVNELLSGEKLAQDVYPIKAEENLILMKNQRDNLTKTLLTVEWALGLISSIAFILMIFCASYVVTSTVWRIILIATGLVIFSVGVIFALKIEQSAGFYKCAHCGHKYVPTFKQVLWSMHSGRTRYMKCPECGKKSWNKKVISDD